MTYGEITQRFKAQLPGMKITDIRPADGIASLYVWMDNSPVNLIARYDEETDTFSIETTREGWTIPGKI